MALSGIVTRRGILSIKSTAHLMGNSQRQFKTGMRANGVRRGDGTGYSSIVDEMKDGKMKSGVLLLDGGTGEELFARNVPDDRKIWSAVALRDVAHHETLKSVHKDFIKAGSRCVTCNNFGVTPGVGFDTEELQELTKRAGMLAYKAREELKIVDEDENGFDSTTVMIMGSLPPLVESYRPDKVMEREKGVEVYKTILSCLDEYVDVWLAETLSSSEEVCIAVSAVVEWNKHRAKDTNGKEGMEKKLFVSMTVREDGCIRSGERASDAVHRILEHADSIGANGLIQAVLFNCSMPEDITLALKDIKETMHAELEERGILLGAYPNRLTKIQSDWELSTSTEPQAMRDDFSVQDFVSVVQEWVTEYNVKLVGGCCGIGPAYINACNAALSNNIIK